MLKDSLILEDANDEPNVVILANQPKNYLQSHVKN